MNKTCITFLLLAIIILSGVGIAFNGDYFISQPKTKTEYLRIHIRADSNDTDDQNVKYKVKQSVVDYLTPILAEVKTKDQAVKALNDNLKNIDQIATQTLYKNGFNYKASSRLAVEEFPLRAYDDLVLESGFYQALIIDLGSGNGDNWWCVVYPPLCFVENSLGVTYTSKILEIIKQFKQTLKEEK